MNAKQLKELLDTVPDETEIIVRDFDHQYRFASALKTTALFQEHHITEDYGEDDTPEAEFGKRQTVIVVG